MPLTTFGFPVVTTDGNGCGRGMDLDYLVPRAAGIFI